jgi:hypothetical protein
MMSTATVKGVYTASSVLLVIYLLCSIPCHVVYTLPIQIIYGDHIKSWLQIIKPLWWKSPVLLLLSWTIKTWFIMLYSLVEVNWCFGGKYRLHLHGQRVAWCLLHDGLLFGLLFDHEHGVSMFLQNTGGLSLENVLYLTR